MPDNPYPGDGTYTMTQEEPPPIVQFQVTIQGDTLTRDNGDVYKWNTETSTGTWKEEEEGNLWLMFWDLGDSRPWMEVDTSNGQPYTYYRGAW